MMEYHNIFPVVIGLCENKNHNLIKDKLVTECNILKTKVTKGGDNWDVSTFNTCGSYNLTENKKFNLLHKWILKQVQEYIMKLGYTDNKVKCVSSWFNIYNQYDYQERHEHLPNDISAIYYLETPKNSGNIKFNSHEPSGVKYCFLQDNPLTWKSYWIKPKPGMLLIFKSNLSHEVQQNRSSKQKISMALNFKIL